MAISDWNSAPKTRLGISGAEPPMTDIERDFQATMRKFALDVMRPIGQKLDRMNPEDVAAKDSPYWEFRRKYLELGIELEMLFELSVEERSKMFCILFEELGYGDSGLAISIGAGMLPHYLSVLLGNEFLKERFPENLLGCWGITEPDHGSDTLDPGKTIAHPQSQYGRPNCIVKLEKDRLVINGQKSSWVSNGTIADVSILYSACDSGNGAELERGCVVMVPLDAKGVSRGKPLDKLGQRALNQGELFFDDVELPLEYLLAGPDDYLKALYAIHTEANALMGATFTGLARAAFDMALEYAHGRKQGGVPIIRHQSVAHRLFHMFRKVEASCALTRRVVHHNQTAATPALQAAMTAKITGTQTSYEVASEALQIFGGNGLTREYPMEKLLRDARASLIEDGCNEILAIKGGSYLVNEDLF